MAEGDITKQIGYDRIEVVETWAIQVRRATKVMEENADGSLTELSRRYHRHILYPFESVQADDNTWTHTATDISGEDASVQAIANTAWTTDVKNAYKTMRESSGVV